MRGAPTTRGRRRCSGPPRDPQEGTSSHECPHASATGVPIAAYAAKSSKDEHDSIGTQITAIRAAVQREGDAPLVVFREEARSGYRGNRGPELDAAIARSVTLADEHGTAELWVWHSSRLARGSGRKGEARSLNEVLTVLRRHGVTVRSVNDNEFTTNPMLWGFA